MFAKMKKILFVALAFAVIFVPSLTTVSAASTTYGSYLDCGENSTVTGSTRQYNQRNYSISLYTTWLQYGSTDLIIDLYRKDFIGKTYWSSAVAYIRQTNTTTSYNMGNHDPANAYYFFSTNQTAHPGHITADPVYMTSRD